MRDTDTAVEAGKREQAVPEKRKAGFPKAGSGEGNISAYPGGQCHGKRGIRKLLRLMQRYLPENRKLCRSFVVTLITKIVSRMISCITGILLARVLMPDITGEAAAMTVIVNFLDTAGTLGVFDALAARKKAGIWEYRKAFFAAEAGSICAFILLVFAAPHTAALIHPEDEERALCLTRALLIWALSILLTPLFNISLMAVRRSIGGVSESTGPGNDEEGREYRKNGDTTDSDSGRSGEKSKESRKGRQDEKDKKKSDLTLRYAIALLPGAFLSGGTGILLAKRGAGICAIAGMNLVRKLSDTLLLFGVIRKERPWKEGKERPWKGKEHPWREEKVCPQKKEKEQGASTQKAAGKSYVTAPAQAFCDPPLLRSGLSLMAAALLDQGASGMRTLLTGALFSRTDLAWYTKGKELPELAVSGITEAAGFVMLPAFAGRDTPEEKGELLLTAVRITGIVVMPLLTLLAVTGEAVIPQLLGEGFEGAVPYLEIFCAAFMLYPVHVLNLSVIKALGRHDLILKLEIIKKAVSMILIAGIPVLGRRIGPVAAAVSELIGSVLGFFINTHPLKKLTGTGPACEIRALLPGAVLSFFTAITALLLRA